MIVWIAHAKVGNRRDLMQTKRPTNHMAGRFALIKREMFKRKLVEVARGNRKGTQQAR
jgi:hypothetical protein